MRVKIGFISYISWPRRCIKCYRIVHPNKYCRSLLDICLVVAIRSTLWKKTLFAAQIARVLTMFLSQNLLLSDWERSSRTVQIKKETRSARGESQVLRKIISLTLNSIVVYFLTKVSRTNIGIEESHLYPSGSGKHVWDHLLILVT